ncbi:putative centrosomal protein [Monocercomonoides exilis]|uniref:putative centrosomal protein n=1 Tax=Monocercomonoides exilis TaxID=2049356 RepID=UPI00355A49F1|nr:putative centrosomal protein [Monocercomonoides exilis]|eukprot:MONOS_8943.1-p1 / transcript=MONOS_8943.1 / gene=MONOS_8943 / organism=Monocercomonoides_exilis_PA203 / gene_product=hypothetical Calmodulin / transcript_product=hypothetical Calmodulin / location=Mono_scaffold00352:47301-48585(+) / protein_length=361 / sequence_SO=supercontig / SO=protein_coding / is_pseudo=false
MERFVTLKKRLEAMKFYEPLGIDSVPLVERLVGELLLATDTVNSLEAEVKKLRQENKSLNSECDYLAHDKSRVVTELNELHKKMVAQSVQAHARERQGELSMEQMADKIKDTRFLNTQLTQRLHEREEELEDLKKKYDELLADSLKSVQTSGGRSIPLRRLTSARTPQPVVPNANRERAASATPKSSRAYSSTEKAESARCMKDMEEQEQNRRSKEQYKRDYYSSPSTHSRGSEHHHRHHYRHDIHDESNYEDDQPTYRSSQASSSYCSSCYPSPTTSSYSSCDSCSYCAARRQHDPRQDYEKRDEEREEERKWNQRREEEKRGRGKHFNEKYGDDEEKMWEREKREKGQMRSHFNPART